ncbi:hypothetical protein NDU88_006199 [Pleurodeles waltl]|uniref:Uncharacterized protein n=1 Tax=Pleurodeles waltl TaxID=8319 RepID=A0AAV7N2C4_PLEWA|nr:hypothetical protein NDU88_006199 [Pleurodeles waltl]
MDVDDAAGGHGTRMRCGSQRLAILAAISQLYQGPLRRGPEEFRCRRMRGSPCVATPGFQCLASRSAPH